MPRPGENGPARRPPRGLGVRRWSGTAGPARPSPPAGRRAPPSPRSSAVRRRCRAGGRWTAAENPRSSSAAPCAWRDAAASCPAMVPVAAGGVVPRRGRRDRRGRQRHRADGPDERQAPTRRAGPTARSRAASAPASSRAATSRATQTPSTMDTDSACPEWSPNGRPAVRLTAHTAIKAALETTTASSTRPGRAHQHGDGEEDLHPRRRDEAGALDGGLARDATAPSRRGSAPPPPAERPAATARARPAVRRVVGSSRRPAPAPVPACRRSPRRPAAPRCPCTSVIDPPWSTPLISAE